jgi:hypothetical protein
LYANPQSSGKSKVIGGSTDIFSRGLMTIGAPSGSGVKGVADSTGRGAAPVAVLVGTGVGVSCAKTIIELTNKKLIKIQRFIIAKYPSLVDTVSPL